MFENIIEQGAVLQLKDDILSRRLAPSMLFYGPPESGKGSVALELARVLSCEKDASWECKCPSCEKHRYLQHVDLLMLGPRSFAAEIAASCSAFLRNFAASGTKKLFIRSLRKLQIRFSPVLMEDDPKLSKLSSSLQSLEEGLSDLWLTDTAAEKNNLEKQCNSLVKTAQTLIEDGIGSTIPIDHIRRAAYWCRLAPSGRRKTLIIENAENMRDEARNSLLKLLEEPPETVSIVLTSQRREAIMPTILSRLRPYRFLKRSAEGEKEVIRRVFQDAVKEDSSLASAPSLVSAYLESFLPGGADKLYPLAAWFIVSLARAVTALSKKNGIETARLITALGQRYAPIANEAGFERATDAALIVKTLMEKSSNFENDSISRFFEICLDMVCAAARENDEPQFIAYRDIFRKRINETETAVNTLNINAALALEGLFYSLKQDMAKPYREIYG